VCTLVGVDLRSVALPTGDVRWVFPSLAEEAELNAVRQALVAADDIVYRVGQVLGARSDAEIGGVPINRFYYQRLGPEPDLPVTVLVAEGGSDQIEVCVLCAPGDVGQPMRRPVPYRRPGPPWLVEAWVSVSCESDPSACGSHVVCLWPGELQDHPVATALEVQMAAAWLLELVTHETEISLRARDSRRGHLPLPQHRD
jgi:hypothetical protein